MKRKTKECGDEVFSNYQSDSPSLDESNRGNSSGSIVLKKGPWTSAEDALLVEYVKKHGEGNWNAVQKHSGLSRCGKSCRLRWANHLRPNLKKGTFTAEEERLIIELHAKMGNKWARMATQVSIMPVLSFSRKLHMHNYVFHVLYMTSALKIWRLPYDHV